MTQDGDIVIKPRSQFGDIIPVLRHLEEVPQHIDIPKELASVKRRLLVPGLAAMIRLGVRLMAR